MAARRFGQEIPLRRRRRQGSRLDVGARRLEPPLSLDGATGAVKNQITKGDWVVRGVLKVDDDERQIWFSASGMYPGKDPYFAYYYRINFDGSGLTRLTADAEANHERSVRRDQQVLRRHLFAGRPGAGLGAADARRWSTWSPKSNAATSAIWRRPAGARRKCSPRKAATARRTSGASSSVRPTSTRRESIR